MANQNCEEFECRIPKDNCNELYAIQTLWFEDKLVINVWDDICVWCGEVAAEALLGFSSALDMDFKDYYLECKRVLTKNGGDSQFVYSIENSHFVWKKVDPDNNIKVKFGNVMVESVPFTDKGIAILDCSFNCVLRLSAALRAEEERKQKCDEELKMLKQKLARLCQEKEKLENELYVKFLSILNQKKEKIRSLEERKYTGKQQNGKLEAEAAPMELKKLGMRQGGVGDGEDHHHHYDSDTDVDASTDEEKPTFDFVLSEPNPAATAITIDADGDLFSEVGSPPAVLPKRARKTTFIEATVAGPSLRKTEINKLATVVELQKTLQSHDFNTQDLFEDM